VQDRDKKSLVLVGGGRTVARYAALYERNGVFSVLRAEAGAPMPTQRTIDLVHIVDCGELALSTVAAIAATASAPVALPFSPAIPLADFEAAVVLLEKKQQRLMLAYAPLYSPYFHKLLHAVSTGIVGKLMRLEIVLPGGVVEFRTQIQSGAPLSPACAGLAYASLITNDRPLWSPFLSSTTIASAQLADDIELLVYEGAHGEPPTLLVIGDASSLKLSADGSRQVLTAVRGEAERDLLPLDRVDIYCATAKAAGLLVDGRTRNIIPGHSGLLLGQTFATTRKSLEPPIQPDPEESGEIPIEAPPPHYDLYQKLPLRWGGTGRESPLWEAKFNIEEICNQDCIFCFARDGDLRLTDLASAPEIFGRLSSEGVEGVMFSGREPTLNSRLPEYIARAKAAGMKNVTVETNALLFADKDQVADCRQAGLDAAFVSFHSARPATVAKLTGTPDSFSRTHQGIINLLDSGVEVELNCVVNRFNFRELEEVATFVRDNLKQITSITFSFVAPLGRAQGNEALVPTISEATPHLRTALLTCEKAGLVALVPGRCGIPLCTLPGMERFYVDYQLRGQSPTTQSTVDREKTSLCPSCRFDEICHGLWAAYARLHGTDEIRDGFWKVNPRAATNADG
jgi:pyruvate-formate lyase-activating enzyme